MEKNIEAIAIGVQKTDKNTFIKDCPFNVLIEHGEKKIKIKNNCFNEFLIGNDVKKQEIASFCKTYSKKHNDFVYHNNKIKYNSQFEKYGFTLYKPNGKSFFNMFGIHDNECNIYFPINNVKSNVINKIIFSPLQLELPTDEESLKKTINLYVQSFDLNENNIKEYLTMLYNASILYPTKIIWKNEEVPLFVSDIYSTSFIDFQSALDHMSDEELNLLPVPLNKDDLIINRIKIQNIKDTFDDDLRKSTIDLLISKYKFLNKDVINDFGKLIKDLIDKKDTNTLFGLQHIFHDNTNDVISSINIKNNTMQWSFLMKK